MRWGGLPSEKYFQTGLANQEVVVYHISEHTMTAQEAARRIEAMELRIAALDDQKAELMERLAYMKMLSVVFFGEHDVH